MKTISSPAPRASLFIVKEPDAKLFHASCGNAQANLGVHDEESSCEGFVGSKTWGSRWPSRLGHGPGAPKHLAAAPRGNMGVGDNK